MICLMPWQPLHRVLRRGWVETAEQLCDDWTVAAGVPPLTLARCLTHVAEWKLAPAVTGMTAVGREKGRLTRRVLRLTNRTECESRSQRSHRLGVPVVMAVSAALLVYCAPRIEATPGAESEATTNRSPSSATISRSAAPSLESTDSPAIDSEPATGNRSSARSTVAMPIEQELRALLVDLREVERLLAVIGDDAELTAARDRLRSRLDLIETRLSTIPIVPRSESDSTTGSPGDSPTTSIDPVLEAGQ